MTKTEFIALLSRWRDDNITRQEADELMAAIRSGDHSELLNDVVEGHLDAADLVGVVQVNGKADVLKALLEKQDKETGRQHKTIHRIHFLRTAWFRVAVAICLFGGVGAYLWLQPSVNNTEIAQIKPVPVEKDVAPGGNKAMLTLADGSTILLDSAANGLLAQQSGATIQKNAAGEIVYAFDKSSLENNVVAYNTMSTPRGGTYQLLLPDGSRVWLNAESSITFPTAFIDNKREVKITGEVYFEIARDKEKPFIVRTRSDEVTVLGTAFNVNAYEDESFVKTSLLEGSIKIGNSSVKPGQAYKNGKVYHSDISQDIAWKKGLFHFDHVPLPAAMRQIERWYDVKVEYRGEIPDVDFVGKMERRLTLQQVLELLQNLDAHFELRGKNLIVSE